MGSEMCIRDRKRESPNRVRPEPDGHQSKSKLNRWPCIRVATSANSIQERNADVWVLLDFVNKHLHVGSGQTVACDSGIHLAAKRLEKIELISVEWLETGMGDVHRTNRGDQWDVSESPSRSSRVSDVAIMSPMLSSLS